MIQINWQAIVTQVVALILLVWLLKRMFFQTVLNTLDGRTKNIADTYENELSIALRVMTNLIEPAMIIVMAVGVGFLLFSVLSAMFAITSNIGGGFSR